MALTDHTWMTRAACRGEDATLFVGPDGELQVDRAARAAAARQFCYLCPVRIQCLTYAVENTLIGIWGGSDDNERRSERRRRQRYASRAAS